MTARSGRLVWHESLFVVVLAIACGSEGPTSAGPGPVFQSLAFHIEPNSFIVAPGDKVRLRAVSDSGVDVSVLWRLADSASGSITDRGLFSICFSGGSYEVVALLKADTTKIARVTPALRLTIPLSIQAIRNVSSHDAVALDSVADSVAVEVNLDPKGLACRRIEKVSLQAIAGDGLVTELAGVTYQTTPGESFTEHLSWNSHQLPNAAYALRVTAFLDRYGPVESSETNITVRNR